MPMSLVLVFIITLCAIVFAVAALVATDALPYVIHAATGVLPYAIAVVVQNRKSSEWD